MWQREYRPIDVGLRVDRVPRHREPDISQPARVRLVEKVSGFSMVRRLKCIRRSPCRRGENYPINSELLISDGWSHVPLRLCLLQLVTPTSNEHHTTDTPFLLFPLYMGVHIHQNKEMGFERKTLIIRSLLEGSFSLCVNVAQCKGRPTYLL